MVSKSTHNFYMSRCIEVAKKGIGKTYPNPSVGCVIVNKDTIISEDFSSRYGGNHAEVNAINKVKNKDLLKTSTLYVTLEPCSHYGKTPPCCNTISNNKIPHVVIGTADNSSKVNGKGIEFLRKNNINVTYGVLEKKCKELHKNFLCFNKNKRPYIILKWAQSNDKLFSPLKKIKNKPFWISSKKSRQLAHKWRSEEHAILVGYNTVINDNPNLNVRSWKGKNPIRIIIDLENKLNIKFKIFNNQAKTIKITKDNIDSSFNVASKISGFLFEKNIQSVIIEGGKKTLEEFIRTNLWDEARIFTNNKDLKTGIKAPKLKGQIILEKKIDNDELKIIKPF